MVAVSKNFSVLLRLTSKKRQGLGCAAFERILSEWCARSTSANSLFFDVLTGCASGKMMRLAKYGCAATSKAACAYCLRGFQALDRGVKC